MIYETDNCPLCGKTVSWLVNGTNNDVIKIKTRRRTTVLVHKNCIEKEKRNGYKQS